MKVIIFLIVLCAVSAYGQDCNNNGKVLACYYASWSFYRNDTGSFSVDHIDPFMCTHIVYTFAGLDFDSKIASLDSNYDIGRQNYKRFTSLKAENPCLKTLLAIGGWNEGSRKYSVMASTPESQDQFVESVLRFLVAYDFDGIDFDWEYPGQRGGIADDRANFATLLEKLKNRLQKWNLLVTTAVPIAKDITETSYDLAAIAANVDYVFLMAYDFTSSNSNVTGLIAPMTNIDAVVTYWLQSLPPEKLILGVPSYARTFNLLNRDNVGIGAPTDGLGVAGEYTMEEGFLSYYELQARLLSGAYVITKVENEENYYAYHETETEWFTFDAEDTYIKKAEYAKNKNLGGMMVWSIDTDDFLGTFNKTDYPVTTTVKNVMLSV